MSLISLANRLAAVRARRDENFEDLHVRVQGAPPPVAASAIERLVEFIPVETVAIYWLAVPAAALLASEAAAGAQPPVHPNAYDWAVYVLLLLLTPLLLLLRFLSLVPRDVRGKLPTSSDWPWRNMGTAMVGFALWALAVPGNPFLTTPGRLMAAWAIAAAVTAILGYLDQIIAPTAS